MSTVVVSETGYVTEQTRCRIHWVIETAGRSAPIYWAHMRCSTLAAPEQMTELNRIIVPNDSSQLLTGPDFKELKTYHRCPAE
jgi:hypothetical protein